MKLPILWVIFIIALLILTLGLRYTIIHFPKTTIKQSDSSLIIQKLKAENEHLLDMVSELDSIASQTKQTAIIYRTRTEYIRLHDTTEKRFTDSSYCHDLERENQNLWYLAELDSTQISTLKRVISNDSLILNECSIVTAKLQERANKEAMRANKRMAWIKSLSIVAILQTLMIIK